MNIESGRKKASRKSIPWIVVVLVLLPIAGVINIFVSYRTPVPVLVFLCANLFAYYFYWDDKRRAKKKEWRIPEANLQFWSLIGGWPGAFIAQQQFRHKTKKIPFQIVFWLIVIAHQVLWFDWLFMDGQWLASLLLVQQGQ